MSLWVTALLLAPAAARASTRVILELDPRAEALVDARLVRRLMLLEAGEVEVPPGPRARKATLFFRVVPHREPGSLRVELWDRGEYWGARTLGASTSTPELRARRLALAAAELATRLREERLDRARLEALAEERRRAKAAELAARPDTASLVVRAGGELAALPSAEGWLGGPRLGAGVLGGPLRLEVSLGALHGGRQGRGLRWWEVALRPEVTVHEEGRWSLRLGAPLAAAAVQLQGVDSVDAIPGQRDSWSARGGLAVAVVQRLGAGVSLAGALEGAWILRPVPWAAARDADRLGGPWIGLRVGAHLDVGPGR